MKETGEREKAAHDRHVERRLGVPSHQQGEERRDEQQEIPPRAPVGRHHQGVEDERQEGRRVGDRPVEPEQQESPQPEGQAAEEGRLHREPLPPQEQEEEDQGDHHAQGRRHPDRRREGERQGGEDQRLEGLRLRIGEQRHSRSGEVVPQRPLPGPHRPPHLGLQGDDLGHQVELQDVAAGLFPHVLRLGHPREDVGRQEHPAQEQRRPEEDHQDQPERRPDARRHRLPPAAERAIEEEGEERQIEAGEENHPGSLSRLAAGLERLRLVSVAARLQWERAGGSG
jgi:hypothetical protein